MSNGPAKDSKIDASLQKCGDLIADPFEISNIRREDYKAYKGKNEYEDMLQVGSPTPARSRGHQGPAAFLIMGSGLDKVCLFYFIFVLIQSNLKCMFRLFVVAWKGC